MSPRVFVGAGCSSGSIALLIAAGPRCMSLLRRADVLVFRQFLDEMSFVAATLGEQT